MSADVDLSQYHETARALIYVALGVWGWIYLGNHKPNDPIIRP
jgi:hypothetical protein